MAVDIATAVAVALVGIVVGVGVVGGDKGVGEGLRKKSRWSRPMPPSLMMVMLLLVGVGVLVGVVLGEWLPPLAFSLTPVRAQRLRHAPTGIHGHEPGPISHVDLSKVDLSEQMGDLGSYHIIDKGVDVYMRVDIYEGCYNKWATWGHIISLIRGLMCT